MARNWRTSSNVTWQETGTTITTAYKELRALNNHVNLEEDFSPVKLQMRPQPQVTFYL